MNFKYTWKKLSEDGLLKDIKTDDGYYSSRTFSEYDTEEEAIQDVKDQLRYHSHIPNELVLVKVLNISWEDRE